MFKHVVAFIVLSILAILFAHELRILLVWLVSGYDFVSESLARLMGYNANLKLVRLVLAYIIIPVFAGLIPAFFYWIFQRQMMPYLLHVIWVFWIALVVAVTVHGA